VLQINSNGGRSHRLGGCIYFQIEKNIIQYLQLALRNMGGFGKAEFFGNKQTCFTYRRGPENRMIFGLPECHTSEMGLGSA
jgi:hypothetical protein